MRPIESNIGFLLNKATRLMKGHFDNHLKEFDITTPQWSVLIDLALHNEKQEPNLSPAAVASRLNMDRPTMSGITERLIKKGLIVSQVNHQDRRSQTLSLTPKGQKLVPELQKIGDTILAKAVGDFGMKGEAELRLYLTKIIKNLE